MSEMVYIIHFAGTIMLNIMILLLLDLILEIKRLTWYVVLLFTNQDYILKNMMQF